MATIRYPGGSQASETENGFNQSSNYYCNLLNKEALNGQVNEGRPFAIASLYIICIGLFLFWRDIHRLQNRKSHRVQLWQYSGMFSMVVLAGFFLKFHDQITIIAGGFGLLAIGGLIKALYSEGLSKLLIFGIVLALLILANNFIYFTKQDLSFLPVIQKVTFLFLFGWIMWINLTLVNKLAQDDGIRTTNLKL